jgi:saccharopine dehydrogenase-like NADP-dependent oxidoreductase
MPENPLILQDLAKESNVTVVPDCGVAPGLSNILVGHAFMQLDKVDEMHVAVGGLPQMPQPPLDYATTWSIRDLIEEYVRPARIVKNGREISVEALSGLEFVNIPGLGKLESFYTDGLRTLLHSMKGVKEMDERTLRYPGHVEKIRVLKDCAFFSEEPIMVNERSVTPKDFSAEVLSRMLVLKDARDLLVLQVQVIGEKEKEKMVIRYQLVDYYDEVWGVSSMSRATAYTNVAVCNLLLRGTLKEIGVIPPEKLGMNNVQFTAVISELNERGVKVEENSSSA